VIARLGVAVLPRTEEVSWSQSSIVSVGGDGARRIDAKYERNWFGSQLADGVLTSRVSLPWDLAQLRTSIGVTRTIFALREYRDRTGALPGALDDLVPSYLPRVPSDLDGRPLRYVREKAFVYSVGHEREDKGGGPLATGDTLWRLWHLENPTFAVPR